MHANVREWCHDGYSKSLLIGNVFDPFIPKSDLVPTRLRPQARDGDPLFYRVGSPSRILRSGSFVDPELDARSASRQGRSPTHRSFITGFRVAKGGLVSKHQSVIEALKEEGIQTALAARERIELRGHKGVDADLQDIAGSDELLVLDRASTAITNVGLGHLSESQNLQLLDVANTAVNNDGLHHLKGLNHISTLILSGTRVTDQGLSRLAGLVNLRRLDLNDTKVAGPGLVHPQDLKLRSLRMSRTAIGLPGLAHVAKLQSLERLHLDRASVSDAALAVISRLKSLTTLHLAGTQITDEGLDHLGDLPNLCVLYLDGTKITGQGLKRLTERTSGNDPR